MRSMKKRTESQCDMILRHLDEHGTITSLEAVQLYGCMRLASRIADLRKKGYLIIKDTIRKTNDEGKCEYCYAEYRLASEEDLLDLGVIK